MPKVQLACESCCFKRSEITAENKLNCGIHDVPETHEEVVALEGKWRNCKRRRSLQGKLAASILHGNLV